MTQRTINGETYGVYLIGGDPQGNAIPVLSGLQIPSHDYVSLSYTGSNLTGVVYKSGGAGGTTVATLTLTYDGSSNLTSVARS
jgi:hypothetical protein